VFGPVRTDHDQRHCYHHVPPVGRRRLLQFISSWWWAWGCPKHVELYLNDEQLIWEIDPSGWLICLNVWWCTDLETLNICFCYRESKWQPNQNAILCMMPLSLWHCKWIHLILYWQIKYVHVTLSVLKYRFLNAFSSLPFTTFHPHHVSNTSDI